ncbi:MAG: PglZ domain-containing protein [Bacteroidia bacterium]|nr:PglZ domain-containing protein [Bacteroidia bacterium]MCO5253695.1 PglZ domain-containing protein [Bacteroidota bacterium]MCZ2129139.1 PglZ domain-containing protein [Bacteroidia bacterium]
MNPITILWADDEIDMLKPHILFLEKKGYQVITVNNGTDAVEAVIKQNPKVVFLDENMPGMSGLEALSRIKESYPEIPVVMITKSEEEQIMEEAIGSKIADYLIKPVNPNQIILSLKKLLESGRIKSEKTNLGYQRDFRNISMAMMDARKLNEWKDIYKKMVYWELEIQKAQDQSMKEVLESQMKEANRNFSDFIQKNYLDFLKQTGDDSPVMCHNLIRRKVLPHLESKVPVFFLLIDNLRYDQWKVISETIKTLFKVEHEGMSLSILPTTTQYCRNSIFSGLLPSEIEKRFPDKWSNDEDEGGRNLYESDFLADLLQRLRVNIKHSYTKVTNLDNGKAMVENIPNLFNNQLNVIVYNFIDTLSHARTDVSVMRELSEDEAAYRSLTDSWFKHSPLWEAIQRIAEKKVKLVIATDHGSVKVQEPVKIMGDRNTTTNLRYKQGKNLSYNPKEVFEIKKPEMAFLPKLHVSSGFVFCKGTDFFAYPNNYNHYVKYYRDTIQHGGISMEEMLVPLVSLSN